MGTGEGKQAGGLGLAHPDTLLQNGAQRREFSSPEGETSRRYGAGAAPKGHPEGRGARAGRASKGLGSRKSTSVRQENSIRVRTPWDSGLRAAGEGRGGKGDLFRPSRAVGRPAPFRAFIRPKGSGIRGIP